MRSSLRLAVMATITAILFAGPSYQQTYSSCNPTQQTCPGDIALGRATAVDFRSGPSSEFTAQGNPTYDSNGVSFTVAGPGQAPQLNSNWYIMFGHVEVVMKAAPGRGIVSSSVLQSDDLDEIDWEWLGAQNDQVQSNYFGKGQTTTYDRAATHAVSSTQGTFHTYTIHWTENRVVWQIDGTTVRVLNANEANGQFPQTPMQFKLGAWSGGDPGNPEGTVSWSQGPTDYSTGPFTMVVQSCSVVDYSTGTKYTYGDTSGAWSSIMSEGGAVNANAGAASGTNAAAPAITSMSNGNIVPFSGTHRSDSSNAVTPSVYPWIPQATTLSSATVSYTTLPGLPSGWTISGSGKVVPPASAAPSTSPQWPSSYSSAVSAAGFCSASGYELTTGYDQRGFLTTASVPIVSTGFDDRGFATTIYPSNCVARNLPMAAGDMLGTNSAVTSAATTTGVVIVTTVPGKSEGKRHAAEWMGNGAAAVTAVGFAAVAAFA
nr:hypothetical protein B0A51_05671 [Rachicladosporium sp. CCFEE 5018]